MEEEGEQYKFKLQSTESVVILCGIGSLLGFWKFGLEGLIIWLIVSPLFIIGTKWWHEKQPA